MADPFELDERTKRLARQWITEIRAKDAEDTASYKRPKRDTSGGYDGDNDGLWNWLTGGDSDGHSSDGGDGGHSGD